ncbi:MAG TPA: hypothetical protein VGK04_02250 [Thermoanaerobaculia bacterium]
MRIEVRSRIGNAVLGLVGLVYVCAALALLAYDLVQTWGAAGLLEYAVRIVLLGSAVVGVLFILIAARNLALRLPRREARHRSEDAAAVR